MVRVVDSEVVRVRCELCGDEASLYCNSDSALLCCKCDARVHEVNFIVARHLRRPICATCKRLALDRFVTGAGSDGYSSFPLCNSCCSPPESNSESESDSDTPSSTSSSCISTTASAAKKKPMANRKMARAKYTRADSKLGAVLTSWCRKIGVANLDEVVQVASRIFTAAIGNNAAANNKAEVIRLLFAASMWLALRLGKAASYEIVARLEVISGLKEKVLVGVAARIPGMVRDRRRRISRPVEEEEEGWGESC